MGDANSRHVTAQHQERIQAFCALVEQRVPELKGYLTFDSTDEEHQKKLQARAATATAALESVLGEVEQVAAGCQNAIEREILNENQPLSLVVTLDGSGQIQQLQRLSQATSPLAPEPYPVSLGS